MASQRARAAWSKFTLPRVLGGFVVAPSVATAWWYRPIGNWDKDANGPKRNWPYMSKRNLNDELHDGSPMYLDMARGFLAPAVIVFWRIVVNFTPLGGEMTIRQDENYEAFLSNVVRRKANQPLITVANHRSLLDDPLVICNLLPWYISVQPRYLRWAICAQDFCYNENLPSLINAFFGTGQSLPIWRGGGINQKSWLDFARHVANGEWCHVFPEAGIWQKSSGELGGRGAPTGLDMSSTSTSLSSSAHTLETCGKLKWGVGKLIAHSPVTPLVVPFHHVGMEIMLEQNEQTRRLTRPLSEVRSLSKGIQVVFGEPIDFSDLIEEHEKRVGKLNKYSSSTSADSMRFVIKDPKSKQEVKEGEVDFHKYWDSTAQEMILYSKITRRIERAMEKLNPNYEK